MNDSRKQESLEDQKLRLEIAELSRPWYAKPVYLQALFPLLVGIATVAVLGNRGAFEIQRATFEKEKTEQNLELKRIEREKIRLQEEMTGLKEQRKKVEDEIVRLQLEVAQSNFEKSKIYWQIETGRERLQSTHAILKDTLDEEIALGASLEQYLNTMDEFAKKQQEASFQMIDFLTREIDSDFVALADRARVRAQTDQERHRVDTDLARNIEENAKTSQSQKDKIASLLPAEKAKAEEIRRAFQRILQEQSKVLDSLRKATSQARPSDRVQSPPPK